MAGGAPCWNLTLTQVMSMAPVGSVYKEREREQCASYLGKELDGILANGSSCMGDTRPGNNSRQVVTEKREELKEAVVREALKRHPDQSARPALAYPQLDKLSTA